MTHRTCFGLLGAINIHRFVFRDTEHQFVNEVDRKEVFQCLWQICQWLELAKYNAFENSYIWYIVNSRLRFKKNVYSDQAVVVFETNNATKSLD